ncbi:hypothetical protein AAH991_36550 [Microbispora sp. ZYX-F-249]|uniref:Uncharacterized protein n=1 Tax=Microbispora maris TaxID=3144104 RepID=A0ABV0AZI4_9ACTN
MPLHNAQPVPPLVPICALVLQVAAWAGAVADIDVVAAAAETPIRRGCYPL